jgi:hypothetical protein
MKRPFVLNVKLNEIQRREQDKYMMKKLLKAKATINIKCPESFNFYKKTFRKSKPRENLSKIIFFNILNLIISSYSKKVPNR